MAVIIIITSAPKKKTLAEEGNNNQNKQPTNHYHHHLPLPQKKEVMAMLVAPLVGGALMLIGVGLMIGGVIALVQPTKPNPNDPTGQKKVPDWPVVVGLLVGGYASYAIGGVVMNFMNPMARGRRAMMLARRG